VCACARACVCVCARACVCVCARARVCVCVQALKLRISQCLKKGFTCNHRRTQNFCLVGADPEALYNLFDFKHFVMKIV